MTGSRLWLASAVLALAPFACAEFGATPAPSSTEHEDSAPIAETSGTDATPRADASGPPVATTTWQGNVTVVPAVVYGDAFCNYTAMFSDVTLDLAFNGDAVVDGTVTATFAHAFSSAQTICLNVGEDATEHQSYVFASGDFTNGHVHVTFTPAAENAVQAALVLDGEIEDPSSTLLLQWTRADKDEPWTISTNVTATRAPR